MSEATAITWSGKSEAMFEIMLGEVPEAMRGMFRGKLSAVIAQKAQGGPAAEDHVTAVVTEIVPEPFKSSILKKFKDTFFYGQVFLPVNNQVAGIFEKAQDRVVVRKQFEFPLLAYDKKAGDLLLVYYGIRVHHG